MKKVYYLATCDTCKRILKTWDLPASFVKQEIKNDEITVKQIEHFSASELSYTKKETLKMKRLKIPILKTSF